LLDGGLLAKHNRLFSVPPRQAGDAHRELSERNRNVLMLVEIEMSAGQTFRFPRKPRRHG